MTKQRHHSELRVQDYVTALTSDIQVGHSCQTLISSLSLLPSDGLPRTLMVSSTQPGEGKTTVAVNLSIGMALAGRKVILVDADLHTPRVHEIVETDNKPGFAELLRGDVQMEETLHAVTIARPSSEYPCMLSVVPSGNASDMDFNRVGTARVKAVVESLAKSHDLVVIDTPPVLTVSDALFIAPIVKGIVFVVDAGSVIERDAKRAKQRIEKAGGQLLGFVLNRFEDNRAGSMYRPYRFYYQRRHN